MTSPLVAAIVLTAQRVHLGSFRATPYGLCAAAGLLLGMTLVRCTARRAALPQDAAWDTGFVAILCCFVASRLLLIARDPRIFLRYPLLFLALPSLTLGGMAIAAVLTWLHLLRKRLPILRMLDAFAAPLALLCAFSELGHWFERSELGMPTRVPWAGRDTFRGATVLVHPVALYGVACGLALTLLLWGALPRVPEGQVAAFGLVTGGTAAFLLDMFSQPLAASDEAWIEPGQWIALAAVLAGALLWMFATRPRRTAVAVNRERGSGAATSKSETLGTEIG